MSSNMSVSSSSNLSLHPPPSSSLLIYQCFEVTASSHIFTALACWYILFFLPLCSFVLHLGLQRWRKPCSASAATANNLDLFTYNIVAMELIAVLGCCFYCAGTYTNTPQIKLVGIYIFSIVIPGQMLFHMLTCLERYLAVIHPVFYLGLRKGGWVRLRDSIIGVVWLMSFGWVGLTAVYSPNFPIVPFAIFLGFAIVVTCFFSLSVLHTLIHPGPGAGGGEKEKVDQLKKRAFHTIVVINGVLLLRFGGQLLSVLVAFSAALSHIDKCVALISGTWFCLPSSYVLPLLFLRRAGKLPFFKNNTESGRASE